MIDIGNLLIKMKMNLKIKIFNIMFDIHLFINRTLKSIRYRVGRFNAKFINTDDDNGVIKIHKWQLKLFKCVTPDDFYITTGIYHALIEPKICEGYRNFGFSHNTYNETLKILLYNAKWNDETMFNGENNIRFTWALGSTPMSIKGLDDWIVIWDKDRVKGEIDG